MSHQVNLEESGCAGDGAADNNWGVKILDKDGSVTAATTTGATNVDAMAQTATADETPSEASSGTRADPTNASETNFNDSCSICECSETDPRVELISDPRVWTATELLSPPNPVAILTPLSTLSPLPVNTEEEPCLICGLVVDDYHACLSLLPSSLMTIQDPRVGAICGEHYLLEEFVQTGETSFVYKAMHQSFGTAVAVKIARGATCYDQFTLLRAQRALRVASRLDHPCIAKVLDLICKNGEVPILVMQWSEGQSLAQIMLAETSFDPIRALNIVQSIVEALSYAREQGVNHIRLKPSAILVNGSMGESVKILDFGIMKMLCVPADGRDASQYRSPEEKIGKPPDEQQVIYSVGVILYELLAGEPFDTIRDVKLKSVSPSLVKVRPDLKEASAFDDVISKCIALKPEDRFKNLEQLSEALAAVRAEASRVANSKMNEQREIAIKDKSQAESQLAVEILLVLIIVASLFFAFFGLHNLLPNMHSQSDFPRSTNGQSHFSAS